jgi:UDP-3-O-[3-hydroxymyristoyl] glucosamine N-acyltransferase
VAHRLAELAEILGGRLEGDPEREIDSLQALEAAGERDLSFLTHARYRPQAAASRAGALLVGGGDAPALAGRDLLVVEDAPRAVARLIALFNPPLERAAGVHETAIVAAGATVDPTAYVGPYAVIGEGSSVGPGAAVEALAVVGRGCRVGAGAVLRPHVVLYDGTEVGERCELHAGAVLGSDGFGYVTRGGRHEKVPQAGTVSLEAEVEVGANSTIDRATVGETRIGAGTKIDNLVQVGHNVQVGEASLLCGQAGIAGSARLGKGVVLAGQAGVAGHLELGDGVQVAAKSAALSSVPAGTQVAGIPAVELSRWRREVVLRGRLAEMSRRLAALEGRLAVIEGLGEGRGGTAADAKGTDAERREAR